MMSQKQFDDLKVDDTFFVWHFNSRCSIREKKVASKEGDTVICHTGEPCKREGMYATYEEVEEAENRFYSTEAENEN